MKKAFSYKYLVILFLVFFGHLTVNAQIGNPCDYQNPDVYCPVDSGVWILLIFALVYGFIRIKRLQKRRA